jgi:hypothetical protein
MEELERCRPHDGQEPLSSAVTGWDGFAQTTGGAAAALIGLLFVAVSIRIDVIARSGDLRNRAAQTLSLLGIVLLVAIAVSLPDQQRWVVGVEIMVVALVAGVTFRLLDRRANKQKSEQQIAHVLDVIAPNIVVCVLVIAAGVLLVFGLVVGLYVLAAAAVIALVGGVVSAWLLLVRVVE